MQAHNYVRRRHGSLPIVALGRCGPPGLGAAACKEAFGACFSACLGPVVPEYIHPFELRPEMSLY